MLTDLEIPLVPNMLAERSSGWVAVYPRNTGDADQIAFATLKALVAHPDLFAEALYRHECDELLDVAEAVARVRTISREMDDDEALPELTKMRDPRQPEWLRTLAGREMARRGGSLRDQIAVHDASTVDVVDPIRDNIAGTHVRYLGDVESIKGKTGVLTGTKCIPEDLGVECVGVMIDDTEWLIPCEFPQFAVCDASSVDDRPGQDAGEALVGVECYVKDAGDEEWCTSEPPLKITAYREGLGYSRLPNPRPDIAFGWWNHARPTYLGVPE